MILRWLLISVIFFFVSTIIAQEKIDKSISFQSDPAKKYSLYIPSSYDENTPNKLMLGLHPLNTRRWNSATWRDKITDMAEMNNLIVLCPDGGSDGRIDDPIDTAFTSALLDSMKLWYNINESKIFVMGFSWGGKTTYTYGMRRAKQFAGFIPIGAAINGTVDFDEFLKNVKDKPFYLIHGSRDTPNTRFYPAKSALINNDAIVGDSLLPDVGHTVDFLGATNMFDIAFDFVDRQDDIITSSSTQTYNSSPLHAFPNPLSHGSILTIETNSSEPVKIRIVDLNGKIVQEKTFIHRVIIDNLKSGTYFLDEFQHPKNERIKVVVH